jgi:23S rRNA (pseudouridine1915-N3)-methyltransferase
MPSWVEQGFNEYAKRINGDCVLELLELPMAKRGKNSNVDQLKAKEAEAITAALKKDEQLVVLDVLGTAVTTPELAALLSDWQMQGDNIALVIGGPDGVCSSLLQKAHKKISLSKLTLPHPLVRVLVAEQLYRAWSMNKGHPYHR